MKKSMGKGVKMHFWVSAFKTLKFTQNFTSFYVCLWAVTDSDLVVPYGLSPLKSDHEGEMINGSPSYQVCHISD